MFTTIHLINQSANETTPFDTYTVPSAFVPAVGDEMSFNYKFFAPNAHDQRQNDAYVLYPNGEKRLLPQRKPMIHAGHVSHEDQTILTALINTSSGKLLDSPHQAYLMGLGIIEKERYNAELDKLNLPPKQGTVKRVEAVDDRTVNLYF